ncbi:MAG: hypothetical protein OXF77_01605 [Thaumarchaeota archaeon]|nr:hypothetical protein [Nitrososphaerota archaeon]
MVIEVIYDNENLLLKRREIKCNFYDVKNLKKENTITLIKDKLKITDKIIIPINLKNSTGSNTMSGTFYIYDDKQIAEKQINQHVFSRLIKDDK